MEPSLIDAILARVNRYWTLADNVEITLEANPTSVEANRFADYRAAGINRVSIGVQSLRHADLLRLGRQHTSAEARVAYHTACDNFDRVSIDLIFGRQHQSLDDWQDELREALAWEAEHLSLYQLTIEPNTSFGLRHTAGKLEGLPTDELAADMQSLAESVAGQSGYRRYETSNYARQGCESRHNLLYWRCDDYLGIGPGAHGRLSLGGRRTAIETYLSPTKWLAMVAETGSGESQRVNLTADEQASEYLMMSLRLSEGTDLQRLLSLSTDIIDRAKLEQLQLDGLVRVSEGRLIATKDGSLLLNSVIQQLLN